MSTIRGKLTKSYVAIITISTIILVFILMWFIKFYFYSNLQETLLGQLKTSAEFYNRYFSSSTLEENVLSDVDVFWKQTSAQVQIIDVKGNILMDSIGVKNNRKLDTPDYKKAIKGDYASYIGAVDYNGSKVMSISYPLKSNEKIQGILRFTTSLEEIDKNIKQIMGLLLFIAVIVVIISTFLSLFLSRFIVDPIKELTCVAEEMAEGNLKDRSTINSKDEIGKLSSTINYMADEIEKKEKLKNEFICSVSHELRTPLTSIKGWAIVLNSEKIDEESLKDGLNIIEKESDRLSVMVEELLDFSKFVSGKIILKKEECNLEALSKYIHIHLKPRAERENIEFKITCEKNLPNIIVDKDRIKQVCLNILDNAFKFNHSGGCVNFSIFKDNDNIIFRFEDNGSGISEEDLPKVKDKFYKGQSSKSQNGIGLSICDEIIKLHNGQFIIKSELNKGTKIEVVLDI